MNTIQLYNPTPNMFILDLGSNGQYTITNEAVVKTNTAVDGMEPVNFDMQIQMFLENAITKAPFIVSNPDTLKVLAALVQEKVEDFD